MANWPFGGRRVTYVGTSVTRVIEDNLLPNLKKTSPIKAILANQNVVSTLIDDIYSGIGFKVNSVFKYAQSDEYPIGLLNYSFIKDNEDGSTYTITGGEDFLPVVFFRHNGEDITTEAYRESVDYKGSNKLLKKLNIDYQDLSDSIHENDQIDDVEEALMIFGVPINSDIDSNKEYIYEFFKWVFASNGTLVMQTPSTPDALTFVDEIGAIRSTQSISFEDKNFKLALVFGGTADEILPSTLPLGRVYVNLVYALVEREVVFTNIVDDQPVDTVTIIEESVRVLHVVKQITETTMHSMYIGDPRAIYSVYGKEVEIEARNYEERILLPINYNLVKDTFTPLERDSFYATSLHLVFNSKVVDKMPWYSTPFFRGVLVIAAVVITVYSIGTAAPEAAAAISALSATYGIVVATIIVAMKIILIQQAISYGFSWLAEELGGEFTFILAAIAMVYGGYKGFNNAELGTKLMAASTSLMDAANNQFAIETEKLVYEQEEFTKEAETLWEELKELENDNFNIFDQIGMIPMLIPGEEPEDFYNRTIHSGNIGALQSKVIENYVELNTRLPTFNDTIRGFNRDGTNSE